MAEPGITTVIPVGPRPHHRRWLAECVASVRTQMGDLDRLVLVVDGGDPAEVRAVGDVGGPPAAQVVELGWTLGPSAAWNLGIAAAPTALCLMVGGDDLLLEGCLPALRAAWAQHQDPLGYYALGVRYSDGRPDQTIPCNAAMVHRTGWRHLGGFPPESAVGAMDAAVISIMMVHHDAGHLIPVDGGRALYWHRVHEGQFTRRNPRWEGVIIAVRHLLTEGWRPGGGYV